LAAPTKIGIDPRAAPETDGRVGDPNAVGVAAVSSVTLAVACVITGSTNPLETL